MSRGQQETGRKSRAEQVASDVEEEFLAARLPVGQHLGRRAEFMTRFAISPTIMSETLRILRDRGLITVRPGNKGGIFVASIPPQIRLGGMDLWFHPSPTHPLELFEARVHLESSLSVVAFDRATAADLTAMRDVLQQMTIASAAREFLTSVMALHRALVTAAHIPVLDGMHQSIVTTLQATLSRAVYVEGSQDMIRHSREVHAGIVQAIEERNRVAFDKVSSLHDADLIRAGDPRRSPVHERAPR